jgi:hypothetical protein
MLDRDPETPMAPSAPDGPVPHAAAPPRAPLRKSVPSTLSRTMIHLAGLERMVRTLKAETAAQLAEFAPDAPAGMADVPTGLSALLAEGAAFAPVAVTPYQPVAPGVWFGIDPEVGGASLAATLKAAHVALPQAGTVRTARLSANPTFPLVEKPRWVTLETAVDRAALAAAGALDIALVASLEIGPGNRAAIPPHYAVTLRVAREGGTVEDHLDHKVPVTTMPMEHALRVAPETLSKMDIANAESVTLIFVLPLCGTYTFHLDWLSVTAVAG